MPPRHAYWTILIGDAPTAFRAREREELLPTFERLRAKQPDAVMRWFERGRLWNSPDDARLPAFGPREKRGAGWRPGGTHRDPRERFKGGPKDKGQGTRDEGRRAASPQRPGATPERKPWRPKGEGFQGQGTRDEGRRPAGAVPERKPWRPKGEGFQGQGTRDEGRRPAGAVPERKPWRPKGEGFKGQRPRDEGRSPAAPKRDSAKVPPEDRPRRSGPRFPKKWQK
jgi:23S rRNA pseudouridine2605 synthase